MTEIETAYIAGFFDGEGWATMGLARSGFYIRVGIGQASLPVLEWIKEKAGGRLTIGIQPTNHLSRKPMHRWEASGTQAYNFMQCIRPFLKVKLKEVDMVMNAFVNRSNHAERAANLKAYKERNAQ